jgi:hypothetical protein
MKTTNTLLFNNNPHLLFPTKNSNKSPLHIIVSSGKYIFYANGNILTDSLIAKSIRNFFSQKISDNFTKDIHLTVLLKIKLMDGSSRSIGRTQFFRDESQLEDYIIYIQHLISVKYNHYYNQALSEIIFEYYFREGIAPMNTIIKNTNVHLLNRWNKQSINYNHFKLPATLNPLDYGNLLRAIPGKDSDTTEFIIQGVNSNTYIITSTLNEGMYHNVVEIHHKGSLGLTYTDNQIDSQTFIRKTDTKIYHYVLNTEINEWSSDYNYSIKPTKYISKIKKHSDQNNNIIAMDIETVPTAYAAPVDPHGSIAEGGGGEEGLTLIPVLISYYDGSEVKSFFITDYNNDCEQMFIACINSLLVKKYVGYKIYMHNFSKFDSVFLFSHLYNYGTPSIIKNSSGNLISATIKTSRWDNPNKNITLKFYDSLLLLNSSLSKLSIAFDTTIKKDIFPFDFVTENNILTGYTGRVPAINYFKTEVDVELYNKYINRFPNDDWDLKNEYIKYCELDCISLHEVLTKFSDLIWNNFSINTASYPTITGLAFAIYRSNFMSSSQIPQICNDFFLKIRAGYTGGATDMFIPSNLDTINNELVRREKLFCYDVNSLYPYVMANTYMPTGKIMSFQGDITKTELSDKLGYYLVEVTAPDNLLHPIIQYPIQSNGVHAMASTLGTWNMVIYSEEMNNAIQYGYKFKVLEGLIFQDREYIFKEYVEYMYNLRLKYDKSHPMNLIAKLLMNSLYGRFGMLL